MKAAPTLDGRIRVDPESDLDLVILRALVDDAEGSSNALRSQLITRMHHEVAEDWEEFVRPDLADQFKRQRMDVTQDLSEAKPGESIFIGPDRAEAWYGSLNQARLSLEAKYHFADELLEDMTPGKASSQIRYHFYGLLQELLLEILF